MRSRIKMNCIDKRNSKTNAAAATRCSEMDSSRKGVKFDPMTTVHEYRRANSDPRSTWLCADEYKILRINRAIDAVKIKAKHPSNLTEDDCFWGLENTIVPRMKERVLTSRARIADGVIAAQKYQDRRSSSNLGRISHASRIHSEWSAAAARKKALFYASQVSQSL